VINIRFLTLELRRELKAPLGLLIQGSSELTMEKLKKIIDKTKPAKIIAVGDKVSGNIIRSGMSFDVAIVDSKIMRKHVTPLKFEAEKTFNVNNPAGTLTDEACQAIDEAVNLKSRVKVQVNGEEDLLTLAAVLSAPNGSLVVYGQPGKGIVVVSVSDDSKRRFREIVDRMECKDSKG
jgi:uncharacterized protein (UPF0218 family)